MNNILEKIVKSTRRRIDVARQRVDGQFMSSRARSLPPPGDFITALSRSCSVNRDKKSAVIAEIKKASPSCGIIRENFHPLELARGLEAVGASAISVLTEPDYFQGSLRYLEIISDNLRIPVLRKDFIIDDYQIYETRLAGADAVLLILAALDQPDFERLFYLASELGLAVLVEVHTEEELARALKVKPGIIGINSRDLTSFETNLEKTGELLARIPSSILKVAESGIRQRSDIDKLTDSGADAFLIGEILMRAAQPDKKLGTLL